MQDPATRPPISLRSTKSRSNCLKSLTRTTKKKNPSSTPTPTLTWNLNPSVNFKPSSLKACSLKAGYAKELNKNEAVVTFVAPVATNVTFARRVRGNYNFCCAYCHVRYTGEGRRPQV